jgi:hypothetical protein
MKTAINREHVQVCNTISIANPEHKVALVFSGQNQAVVENSHPIS